MFGHWQTDDETAIILESLSHFSDGSDSRAVDLRRHAETIPLTAVAETWHLFNGTLAEAEIGPKVILE